MDDEINMLEFWPIIKWAAFPAMLGAVFFGWGAFWYTPAPVIRYEAEMVLVTATAADAARYVALLRSQTDSGRLRIASIGGGVIEVTGIDADPEAAAKRAKEGAAAMKLYADRLRNSELQAHQSERDRYGLPPAPPQFAPLGIFDSGAELKGEGATPTDTRPRNGIIAWLLTMVVFALAMAAYASIKGKLKPEGGGG